MFAQPASPSSDFKISDYPGHLFLIYPREHRTGIQTTLGTAEAISADLVLLTDQSGPRTETNVLIFQKVLVGSLKNSIGKDPVLGRLGRGVAKPGQTAPYVLEQYTDADAAYATQYLQAVGGNPFPQASPFQAPPAAAPVPAPAHAPLPQTAPVPVPQAPAAPFPAAPGVSVGVPAPVAAMPQQYAATGQAIAAAIPTPAPAPVAAPITLPTGQQVSAEQAAAMAALGMTAPPAPAPAGPHL
ncbi:hypothetical protein [Streptosporangium sp. NPDC051022]|uniref:hypothetical protein n=1 Tax=Streptosporangium sp. NPDC051022 TaxID=3155752 RepID=UPI00342F6B87